jgi:hypothetical protein
MSWYEVEGGIFDDAGDQGGDVQVGRSFSKRFHNTKIPGVHVDAVAYPVAGDGNSEPDLTDVGVQLCVEFMICTDLKDPGGTEKWCDYRYSNKADPLRYGSVKLAEAAARKVVENFTLFDIDWDGEPFR